MPVASAAKRPTNYSAYFVRRPLRRLQAGIRRHTPRDLCGTVLGAPLLLDQFDLHCSRLSAAFILDLYPGHMRRLIPRLRQDEIEHPRLIH